VLLDLTTGGHDEEIIILRTQVSRDLKEPPNEDI
jgi:hypothetical protein